MKYGANEKMSPRSYESLAERHWFEIAQKLAEESGSVPGPMEIRAAAIISILGLPSGEVSALEINKRGERLNPEKDRIIAEYLTNKPGVFVDKEKGIVSTDFRDIYPNGLPQELKIALDPDTRAIMEIEYEHAKATRERFADTKNHLEADCPIHYFRLPGGVDLFLRGYMHNKAWQKNHGEFLQKANAHAQVIAIEGLSNIPFGESLDSWWSNRAVQFGHYDVLMQEAVGAGFKGLLAEVDARDESKISMDNDASINFLGFTDLFFREYFAFFEREHPSLAEKIGSSDNLKIALEEQSTMSIISKEIFRQGKRHVGYIHFEQNEEVSFKPTFLELGQHLFSDALAALKLHLIAKLMTDGYLPKGPIIDYEGANHLPGKSFFLRYPRYAVEVVLRTVNELMAGRVKESNIEEIYKVFQNPNWPEILREIVRLSFKKIEDDPSKSTAIGPNQRKLFDYPVDFLGIYGINPEQAMPTDDEIKEITAKLGSAHHVSIRPTAQ